MKIMLRLEYAGEPFHGWQCQHDLPTVQGELEQALGIYIQSEHKKLGLPYSETISVTGSGRTDRGVSASDQVASFTWPKVIPFNPQKLIHALNGISRPELTVLSAEEMPDTFDARHSAHIKTYTYTITMNHSPHSFLNKRSWCLPVTLHIPSMIEAAHLFVGQHDFSSFRSADCTAKSTIRTIISSEITKINRYQLSYSIQGKGFLKQMVRIIVGTLVEIGTGKRSSHEINTLLISPNRMDAGKTAPAAGLHLKRVDYI